MSDHEKVINDLQMQIEELEERIAIVLEQKTGHWIWLQYCANEGVYCSECHTKMFDHYPMKKKTITVLRTLRCKNG